MEQGEVYVFDFRGAEGSEAEGVRPGIVAEVVRRPRLETRLIVPLTTELRRLEMGLCVFIARSESGLHYDSVAQAQLLRATSRSRRVSDSPIGRVSERTVGKIHAMITEVLGIDFASWDDAE